MDAEKRTHLRDLNLRALHKALRFWLSAVPVHWSGSIFSCRHRQEDELPLYRSGRSCLWRDSFTSYPGRRRLGRSGRPAQCAGLAQGSKLLNQYIVFIYPSTIPPPPEAKISAPSQENVFLGQNSSSLYGRRGMRSDLTISSLSYAQKAAVFTSPLLNSYVANDRSFPVKAKKKPESSSHRFQV